jgi:hypothetical protein
MSERQKLRFVGVIITTATVALLGVVQAPARGGLRTQNFATDPGWDALNNTTGPQNFGFSNTSNTTGSAGEMGGLITRDTTRAYYADRIESHTLDEPLSVTGKLYLQGVNASSGFLFGFFNQSPATSGANAYPKSFLGFQSDGNNTISSDIYIIATDSLQGGVDFTTHGASGLVGNIPRLVTHDFSLTYDPSAGASGQITMSIGPAGPLTINLTPAMRTANATFDRFGLLGLQFSGTAQAPFFDNLVYTPEPGAVGVILGFAGLMTLTQRRRRRACRRARCQEEIA